MVSNFIEPGFKTAERIMEVLGIPDGRNVFSIQLNVEMNHLSTWTIKCYVNKGEPEAIARLVKECEPNFVVNWDKVDGR
jgi:hypothetical protein